jgi:hypothetical protein
VCTLDGPGECIETDLDPGTAYTYEVTARLGTQWTATATVTATTASSGESAGAGSAPEPAMAGVVDSGVVVLDAPVLAALALAGDGDGVPEEGETVTVTFGRRLDPASLCGDWDQAPGEHTRDGLTVTVTPGAEEAQLIVQAPEGSCDSGGTSAFHLGTIGLATGYVVGADPLVFTGSTAVLDADHAVVTLTLGALASGEPGTVTGSGPATFTPEANLPTDAEGNPFTDGAVPEPRFVEDHPGGF